jgi:RNA polymerase sigma factor (sigma-70 family)
VKTDVELIKQAGSDPEAFAEIYRRHSPSIHAWLRARTRPDIALELTAETFCEAALSLRRFRDLSKGSALPWLYGITRNLLLRYLERQRAETRARDKLRVSIAACDDGFDAVDERLRSDQLRHLLASALAALPEKQRRAVELRAIEELSYAEVARNLGCTPLAARLRVHRALSALERALAAPVVGNGPTLPSGRSDPAPESLPGLVESAGPKGRSGNPSKRRRPIPD